MTDAGRILVFLFGAWLLALSLYMFMRPRWAIGLLSRMGSTASIHFSELGIRLAAGIGMIAAAPVSRAPDLLGVIGWFIAVSSAVLMLLPRQWHSSYSTWWAVRIPTVAVKFLAPVSAMAGGLLMYSVWPV